MGLFDSYQNVFKIGNTVSDESENDPYDVLKTKSALRQTGHYTAPNTGLTDKPDQQMIKGIKKFQVDNDLKVDGIMKPNGPTETKIDEQLNNPFKLESNQKEQKVNKIKPPKIDPMTGLAEIKMPKLKTAIVPNGNTVGQRIQSIMTDKRYIQKKEKPIVDHVVRQFERAYPGLTQYDETGKMIQPTPMIKPQEVEPFDPDGELNAILNMKDQVAKSDTFNDLSLQTANKQESSDGEYKDSEKCMELKSDYENAIQNYNDARRDYLSKSDELSEVGREATEALENLKQILSEVAFAIVFRGIKTGRVRGSIDQAKKEAKAPVNWSDVFENAWTLYKAPEKEAALKKEVDALEEDRKSWYKESERILTTARENYSCRVFGWRKRGED